MKNNRLLGTSALVPFALIGSFMISTPAFAQAPDPARPNTDSAATVAADATDVNEGGEGITVVGSRTRRNQFNTADPINLITRDEATQAGFASTAEILQSTA